MALFNNIVLVCIFEREKLLFCVVEYIFYSVDNICYMFCVDSYVNMDIFCIFCKRIELLCAFYRT